MGRNHRKNTNIFIAGIVLSIAGFAVSVNALPSLVTGLASRFNVNPGRLGTAFFFQFASFAFFSSLSGYILGRGKGKAETILVMSLLVSGIVIGFIGILPTLPSLILFMIVIGGCGGMVESIGTTLLTARETNSHGRYVHISQLFYCLGAMLAPMLIGILLTQDISMQSIGLAVGILTLFIAFIVTIMIAVSQKKKNSPLPAPHPITDLHEREKELTQEKSPRIGIFIWFLLAMFLYVTLEVSIGSWLPTYLETSFSLSAASASMHLTLYWTGLATTRFIYIFVHSGSIRKQILLHMAGIFLSFLYLLFVDSSTVIRALMIFILGLSCGPVWPLIVNLYSKMYSHKNYVMYLVSAGSVGALVGIFLTSAIIESQGVASLMATTTVYGSLLITAYVVLMAKTKRKNKLPL